MKILTILIFSGDRLCVKNLLNDISELNRNNIDVVIVDWSKKKRNLEKKKNCLSRISKEIIKY